MAIMHADDAHMIRRSDSIVLCLACDDEDYARPCPAAKPAKDEP